MKKLIIFLLSLLIFISCSSGISQKIPVKEGDTRITITEKHVIHEVCSGVNSFGEPFWHLDYIESIDEYKNKLNIE